MYNTNLVKTMYTRPVFPASGEPYFLPIGRPLSGKGTQSEILTEIFGFRHVSTGDWVRAEIKNGTPLGKQVADYNNRGELVPDEIIIDIFELGMNQYGLWGYKLLLDGFPRTLPQLEYIETRHPITLAMELDVSEKTIREKRMGRLTCSTDGSHIYHQINRPPKENGKCDIDGAALYVRKDDDPTTVERRLQEFNKALPVVDEYIKRGRLLKVDGEAAIKDISDVLTLHVGLLMAMNEARKGRSPKTVLEKILQR